MSEDIRAEPTTPGTSTGNNGFERTLRKAAALPFSEMARKSQLSALDQGVISLANFAATILLARFVTPTELGVYTVGFLLIYLVRALQEGVIVQPLNALGAVLEGEAFRAYASATAVFQAALALLSAAVVGGLGWLLTEWGNDVAGPTLFALWSAFLFWQSWEYVRRVFYTRGEVGKALTTTIVSSIIRLAVILWLGSQNRLNGVAGLHAIAWGSLAAFLLGMLMARRYWTRRALNLSATWQQNWKFGRWILGGTVANWVTLQLYPILTAGMISFAAAGAYQALQNLVAPVHVLLRAADTFLTPLIARTFHQRGFGSLTRTLRWIYLIVGLPVLGLLLAAVIFVQPLLRLIRDDTYLPFSQGIFIMAVFYALWYAYSPLQTAFKAIRHSRPIFLANVMAVISMLTVGVWAILQWGVYGTMAGQALNALIINLALWSAWFKLGRSQPGAAIVTQAVDRRPARG